MTPRRRSRLTLSLTLTLTHKPNPSPNPNQAQAHEEACTSSTGGRGVHNGHGASGRSLTPPFAREDSEANMFSVSVEMAPG